MIRKISVLAAAFALGACTLTTSTGDQVVLTPANSVPLVIDQIKKICAAYDANKVTADALTAVATQAINNTSVTNAVKTVSQIASDACPLLETLIQEKKSASTPAAVVAPAPAAVISPN